jgi:polyisoprenyl-phosphate glycosyltransferase
MTIADHRKKIAIVTPVFNDWEAFGRLLAQLREQAELGKYDVYVIAVDDGSSELADTAALIARRGILSDIRVVRLACNLGHQRAIAVGLVAASKALDIGAVVVMDSDGEDQPDAVARLIAAWDKQPGQIVVARRGQRSERLLFRLFYSIYKLIFRIMTGQLITFGNFCLVPRQALKALVHDPAIWNNLAAAIARSRIPYTEIHINRGPRLAGRSRMTFVSLAVHGLSAISVYTDIVLVRIIVAACIVACIVVLGLIAVIAVKFGTDLAIPGWASYVAASLTVIFVQTILLAGVALFQLLSFRSLKPFIPASDASAFVVDAGQDRGRQL